VWIKTPAGKAMPCDPAPVYYKATPDGKDKVVTTRGEGASARSSPGPTPPTPATGHTGPPARRPTASREEAATMNRDKARELLEKELRIRPTVKASAIFTGKNGSMGFRTGRFYAVTIVKRKGVVVLIAPDDGLKCPYSSLDTMLNKWHILLVIFNR